MRMISSRTLAARPGRVWEDLEREGVVVITEDGLPRSIMIPTSDATLLEDIQELVFARARRAVREIRSQSRAAGTVGLTSSGIDQEIKEARRTRSRDARG